MKVESKVVFLRWKGASKILLEGRVKVVLLRRKVGRKVVSLMEG